MEPFACRPISPVSSLIYRWSREDLSVSFMQSGTHWLRDPCQPLSYQRHWSMTMLVIWLVTPFGMNFEHTSLFPAFNTTDLTSNGWCFQSNEASALIFKKRLRKTDLVLTLLLQRCDFILSPLAKWILDYTRGQFAMTSETKTLNSLWIGSVLWPRCRLNSHNAQ